jgi:prophage antirepressor-like protein
MAVQYVMKLFEDPEHDKFRVVDRDGEPWFVLAEVAKKLGIGNPSDVASTLDDDEKGIVTIDTPGGKQRVRIINESGLYSVILRSRKPEAKAFRKWITSEVLPSIRKTGGYRSANMPAFIQRAAENWDRVAPGYFSVISELAVLVAGRLERAGHILADRSPDGKEIRPDTAIGRRFSDWLKLYHPALCDDYRMYQHWTPEWEGPARQYPYTTLPVFREYVEEVWWPEHAAEYLRTRDPAALEVLQKLLPPKKKPHLLPA